MNPNLCHVVLRPRGPLTVFDLTWRFLAARWPAFLRLFLMVYLPLWLVILPVVWLTDWHWGVGLVGIAVGWGARVPFTLLAGRAMFAESVPLVPVVGDCLRRTPMGLMALLIHSLALVAGGLTCGMSLVLSAGGLSWLAECILLEQRPNAGLGGGWTAARRSWHLATQGPVAAMAAIAGTLFLTLWFAALAEAVGAMCTGFLLQFGTPFGSPWALQVTPWMLFGVFAAQPIIATYRLLLYVDTRTRVEGWDLQVGLRALGLA